MTGVLHQLGEDDLRRIAEALRMGRLNSPINDLALGRYISETLAGPLSSELALLEDQGMTSAQIALLLEAVAEDRSTNKSHHTDVELVSTGPEGRGVANRDTRVVVRQLFASARESVVVAGFAVYQGRQVFAALAERMDEIPNLKVRMYLDIQRPRNDTSTPGELVRKFSNRFRTSEWPGTRFPDLYYDPRSLELDLAKRSSLHAKCVVVDGETCFIGSANFTEAAQVRNIEIGLLVRSETIARRVVEHFAQLADSGALLRLPSQGRIST